MSGCFDTAWAVIKIDSDEERIRYLREATDAMYGPHQQRTLHDYGLPLDANFAPVKRTGRFFQALHPGHKMGPYGTPLDGDAEKVMENRMREQTSRLGLHDFDNVRIEPTLVPTRRSAPHHGRTGPAHELALVGERDGKKIDLSSLHFGVGESGKERMRRPLAGERPIEDFYGKTNPAFRRRDMYRNLLLGLINAGYPLRSDERNHMSHGFHRKLLDSLPKGIATSREHNPVSNTSLPDSFLSPIDYFTDSNELTGPPSYGSLKRFDPVGIPVKIPISTYGGGLRDLNLTTEDENLVQSRLPIPGFTNEDGGV